MMLALWCTPDLLDPDQSSIDGEQPFWKAELICEGVRVGERDKCHWTVALQNDCPLYSC